MFQRDWEHLWRKKRELRSNKNFGFFAGSFAWQHGGGYFRNRLTCLCQTRGRKKNGWCDSLDAPEKSDLPVPGKALKNCCGMCRIAGLVQAWDLFTKLKLPSHAISPSFHIACQKTEFRSRWLHQSKGKGRAATGASKITFLEVHAKSGVDLTSRILHQANLQSWALVSSLCSRTVSWLVARISWAYFGF